MMKKIVLILEGALLFVGFTMLQDASLKKNIRIRRIRTTVTTAAARPSCTATTTNSTSGTRATGGSAIARTGSSTIIPTGSQRAIITATAITIATSSGRRIDAAP
jgi:hypothetical protein